MCLICGVDTALFNTSLGNMKNAGLLLYRTGRHAVDQELGQEEIQNDDGNRNEDRACRKTGELRFTKVHQTNRYCIQILLFQKQLRKDEVTPGPYELRQERVHNHWGGQRQGDLRKHLEVGRAIHSGCFVNGVRNGIEEALLCHVTHWRTGRIDQDQSPMLVDQIELCHQNVHCCHGHKGWEHSQDQRTLHQRLTALELEPAHTISRQYCQKCTDQAAHDSDKQRILKPLRVIVDLGIVEQLLEACQTILRREETVEGVDAAGFTETGQCQPKDWEKENEADGQNDKVCNGRIEEYFRR